MHLEGIPTERVAEVKETLERLAELLEQPGVPPFRSTAGLFAASPGDFIARLQSCTGSTRLAPFTGCNSVGQRVRHRPVAASRELPTAPLNPGADPTTPPG